MSGGFEQYHPANPNLVSSQYGSEAINFLRRKKIYQHTDNPIETGDILQALEMGGGETVLDIGCADADWIRYLSTEMHHQGHIVGMDVDQRLLEGAQYDASFDSGQEISFLAAKAEQLPLAKDSIDVVFSLFMLYHTSNIEHSLDELQRVLKPEGIALIATSSRENKLMHRQFEADIAEYLGIAPPPIFTDTFDSEIAEAELPLRFRIENRIQQDDYMRIKSGESLQDYYDSLSSMKNAFSPEPTIEEWHKAMETVVFPVINDAIDVQRFFADTIKRDWFICRNPA